MGCHPGYLAMARKMQGIRHMDSVVDAFRGIDSVVDAFRGMDSVVDAAVKSRLIEVFVSLWRKKRKRTEKNLNTGDNKGSLVEHHSCCYTGKIPKPVKIFQANNSPGFEDMTGYNTKCKTPLKVHIINEFVTSERDHVERLELVCKDFRNFMIDRGASVQVLQFNNLTDIYNLGKSLLDRLEVRLKTDITPPRIADILLSTVKAMSSYILYIHHLSRLLSHFDQLCESNKEFGKLVEMFEKMPKCRKLKIKHFLVKPVQRLPQYKLLLTQYIKELITESDEYRDTKEALKIVGDILEDANKVA